MNTAQDILTYAQTKDIQIHAKDGQLKVNAPRGVLTDEFLETAKQHKAEIIMALERWNPELASEVYVWCVDCQHFNSVNCNHPDNPFRTVEKQPAVARKCQWFNKQETMK